MTIYIGVSAGGGYDAYARMLSRHIVRHIPGNPRMIAKNYPGGADVNLATERGEVDGRCSWSWSSIQATGADWLKGNKINLVVQFSFKQHPDLKHVPLIRDLVTNKKDRDALDFHLAPQVYGRPVGTGPRVPHARYVALKKAFWDTMHDPKFLAEAKLRRLPISPTSGDDVSKLIKRVYAMPKDIIAHAKCVGSSSANTQVAKAVVPVVTHKGSITKLKRGGRRVSWKGGGKKGKLRVSGSRTKITVAGKKAKRKALKVGMNCAFTVKGASTALKIACN